jgi:hypothetical protein
MEGAMTMATAKLVEQTSESRLEYRFLADERVARWVVEVVRQRCTPADEEYFAPWRTTTYCDTPAFSIYQEAEAGSPLCMRFREYHPNRPDNVLTSPNVWFELKEDGGQGRKERVLVPSNDALALLTGAKDMPDAPRALRKRTVEWVNHGARPVLVTRYRRLAYEGIDEPVRVTVDRDLSYLSVDWDSQESHEAGCALGSVVGVERGALIEIKCTETFPAWANELIVALKRRAAADRPSKFLVGMRYLLEHLGTTVPVAKAA